MSDVVSTLRDAVPTERDGWTIELKHLDDAGGVEFIALRGDGAEEVRRYRVSYLAVSRAAASGTPGKLIDDAMAGLFPSDEKLRKLTAAVQDSARDAAEKKRAALESDESNRQARSAADEAVDAHRRAAGELTAYLSGGAL